MWSSRLLWGGRLLGRGLDFTPQPPSHPLLVYEGSVWTRISYTFHFTGEIITAWDCEIPWKFVEELMYFCLAAKTCFPCSATELWFVVLSDRRSRDLRNVKRRKIYFKTQKINFPWCLAHSLSRSTSLTRSQTMVNWKVKVVSCL